MYTSGNGDHGILTDSDCVDHDRHFGNAPTQNDTSDAEMILERASQEDEAANVQRYSDIARPVSRVEIVFPAKCEENLPQAGLCLEYTIVAANREVHDPIVEVSTENLADKYSHLFARPG